MLEQRPKNLKEPKKLIRKRILYVEDDVSSQFLVEHILRRKYDIDVADKGVVALEKVQSNNYDLILMDIKLGKGITGIEVTHEIRKLPQYRNTPILAVTAYAMPGDDDYIKEEGCNDYISKPIDFRYFKEKVDRLLQKDS
ncbi:MAG: response regulator [Bacteroidales bacterium]|nr:response regulator [Bacteroidales bacterium]